MAWKTAAASAGPIGRFLRKAYIFLFVLFIVLILLKAIVLGIESKDPFVSISYLGNKLAYPTVTLLESSQTILSQENFVINGSIWQTLLTYSDVFSSLISIFFWLLVLKWFVLKLFVWDDSKTSVGWFGAIIGFFVIQALALAITGNDPKIVWHAFVNFVKSVAHIINNFGGYSDKIIKEINVSDNFSR